MKNKYLTRRKFLRLSGEGITGLGAGALLPPALLSFADRAGAGFASKEGLVSVERSASPGGLTAGEVLARIKKQVGTPWKEVTVDTIKGGGNPDIVVTGIATSFMATLDVLERSVKAGHNFILAHEPTFWTNLDLGEGLAGDPLYAYKQEYIKKNGLFVHRFHDHWHARRPDGIFEGWNKVMGWDGYRYDEVNRVYELPEETTLAAYAKIVKRRLASDGIRVMGDAGLRVRTVNIGSNKVPKGGAPSADVTITYEPDRENTNVEWERDLIAAGQKKGFIIVSHNRLEEFGMDNCAVWLRGFVPEVPVKFIPSGDPFWRTVI